MIIKYEKNEFIKKYEQIEIEDTKNIFLKGRNPYDHLPTFFGIWINGKCLSIVTIVSYHTISYKYYLNINLPTKCDIQNYLQNNDNVKIITKSEFKEQMDHVRSILKI